jgi:hypothetical protein
VPRRSGVVVLPSSLPPAAVASRTRHPPYKQLLVGMGLGARCHHLALLVVLFGVVIVILWPWSTRDPPNEQWLIGVAGGAPSSSACRRQVLLPGRSVALALPAVLRALWVCIVVVSRFVVVTIIFHPSSTPRAVALGAGGGWCVWRRRFVVVVGSWGRSSSSSMPAVIHSLYPTCKQVLAAVGMGGGSALSQDSVGGGFECVSDVPRVRGCGVLTGIPLLGSPGVPLCPPNSCRQPHIP